MLTFADVLKARVTIGPTLRPTPALESDALGAAMGCRVVLKCENLNPTGAFKVRGGVNLLASLDSETRAKGVVAASTGNHAQSVAFAARRFGARAIIYMPERSNVRKVAATSAYGAEVVLCGRDFDEARLAAEARAKLDQLRYIHSADEPLLVAGVATWALELLEIAPDLDTIFVPVGGGSGVLGAGLVARAVNPRIQVIGVQAEGAPAVYRSWKEGRYVETERAETVAEGIATRQPFALPLALFPTLVDEIMLVSDAEIYDAIRLIFESTRQVAEGAGAAAVAGAFQRRDALAGKNVGLVLSGGNITTERFMQILNQHPGSC
ncbi:MAG: threonine/serine dehydratase [Isosphaeraceae bacterium]